jgi:integrase
MSKKFQTIRNPSDCKKIARSGLLAISHKAPDNRKTRGKGIGRDQLAYWKKALRVEPKTGKFFVQIHFLGERGNFTFEKNAETATEQARQIYNLIRKEGWPAARERYSPRAASESRAKDEKARVEGLGGRIENPTIGDLLREAEKVASHCRPASFHSYCKAIRFLASELFEVSATEQIPVFDKKKRKGKSQLIRVKELKRDYRGGGLKKWRAVIDAFPLSDITTERVEKWRKEYLDRAGDPAARDHAKVSFNKTIRCAKALFSKKRGLGFLPKLENRLVLPNPLPLANVPLEKEPPATYRSKIDPGEILQAALVELQAPKPELFKALILSLVLGLRRTEADTLLWRQVDFKKGEVLIEPTEFYALKSYNSAGVIALDPQTLAFFKTWKANAEEARKGNAGEAAKLLFVMESPLMPKPNARTPVWRCKETFTELLAWLRGKGVNDRKPIHTLRKEAGTILIRQGQGIEYVAKYLRHSDIKVTLKHYSDLTQNRTAVDLGALLPPPELVKFPPLEALSSPEVQTKGKAKKAGAR